MVPSNNEPWAEGKAFYGYDPMVNSLNMGYRGPTFSYARDPRPVHLAALLRPELARPHAPVMAEIDFVSSHTPWTPLPRLVPWSELGDGSVFDPQPAQGIAPVVAWQDPKRVQELYGQSVQYTLGAMFSFLHTYDQPNLVLIVLGDHQPARIVSGPDADHDVPISIISKDPAVFDALGRVALGSPACSRRRRLRCGGWTSSATGSWRRSRPDPRRLVGRYWRQPCGSDRASSGLRDEDSREDDRHHRRRGGGARERVAARA